MEFEEEPGRIKDEETEEQIDPMGVNEDKQQEIQTAHDFKNEDGNTVISKTEKSFTQKNQKTAVKGSFSCSQCGNSFSYKGNLKTHMRIHTGEKPFTCSQCGHTIVKMEFEEEPCRIKDEETEEQTGPMDVNVLKQYEFPRPHFANEVGNIISETEEKTAGTTGLKGSLTCAECGKSFTDKSNLKRHMRIHTGEKPFTCSQCGNSFTYKGALNDHLRRHSGVKSFRCDQCEKTFVFSSNLREHLKVHTGLKPHVCTFCGKSFSLLRYLKDHESIHTGVRPHVCLDCGRSYITSSALKTHQRTHTGEKPHMCSHCGRCFARSDYLKVHERVHTGEKPYQCSSCGRSFVHLSSLQTHKKKRCPKFTK